MRWKILIVWLIILNSIKGQSIAFVSDFKLIEVEQGVFLNWQIDSGYICQGIDILRSNDGVNFEEIGHISGVCGSLTKDVSYSFLDSSPENGRSNYYRLKINGFGETEILELFFLSIPDDGARVYPNPASQQQVNVKFENSNNDRFLLRVVSLDGRLILSEETIENEFVIPSNELSPGIYTILISGPSDDLLPQLPKLVVLK